MRCSSVSPRTTGSTKAVRSAICLSKAINGQTGSSGDLIEPGPPIPAATVVEEVYKKIVGMQRDATIDLAVEMGKLIVDTFYKGDLQGWRKAGNKEASLRKLAERFEKEDESSGMSAAGIYRVVAIYELDKRLSVSSRKHLTVTHIRSVIGIPPADQKRLDQIGDLDDEDAQDALNSVTGMRDRLAEIGTKLKERLKRKSS